MQPFSTRTRQRTGPKANAYALAVHATSIVWGTSH
jgi:hypothetical protein